MRWPKLFSNDRGNVATIFALTVIPMLLAAGCAVDYMRTVTAKTALQNAVDSAVLAAGASNKSTAADIEALVNKYLAGNNYDLKLKSVDSVNVGSGTGNISVSVTGEVSTSFMSLAGINTFDITALSEVTKGSGAPLELVMALDNTGSMAGSKMDTLKTAAKDLVNSIMVPGSQTKIGLVPFNIYVNVGEDKRGESWLSVEPDKDVPSCYDSYPNKTGCTITTSTCYADGIPYSCQSETCTDMGAPVQVCTTVHYGFYGCVASRMPAPMNSRIDSVNTDPYTGLINNWCAPAITDLTDVKSDLVTAIDGMITNQETFIPGGLLWGWNLLTPEAPFTKAMSTSAMAAAKGKKALVLMTDGENTLEEGSYLGVDGIHWGCSDPACPVSNPLTSQLCENIKADGIVLYTILFDVTDTKVETMLRDCASDPSMSYVAGDNAALLAAFSKIGGSLSQLRLSK